MTAQTRPRSSSAERGALYPRVMGAAWASLDPAVVRSHLDDKADDLATHGSFTIRHGHRRLARWLCRALRMPAEGVDVPIRLLVVREGPTERWHRTFGGRKLVTIQREQPSGVLAERFGCLELRFRLAAENAALVYRSTGARLRLGPLSLPLPRKLSPTVVAREEAAGGGVRIAVAVTLPFIGPLIEYTGEIVREEII